LQGVGIGGGRRSEAKPIEGAADFEAGELGASGALGPRRGFDYVGDVAAVAGEVEGVADEAPGGGQGERGKGGGGDEDGGALASEVALGEALHLTLPI